MTATDPRSRRKEAGFTVVELLVYIVIAAAVAVATMQFLVHQSRSYTSQRELLDARETVRGALVLLSWEMRQLSAAGGDIYTMSANSIALRSTHAQGVICGEMVKGGNMRYGIWSRAGDITVTSDDTSMVYTGSAWQTATIDKKWDPKGGGVTFCEWGGSKVVKTGVVIQFNTAPAGLGVGAPWREFRRVEYGLFQADGRWWLGRKVGAGSFEKLTGPVRAGDGLAFAYYDENGAVTADRTQVASVEIVIRSESTKPGFVGSVPTLKQDSVRTRVTLRG